MDDVEKREFTAEERRQMAEEGAAMPDGSFPIATRADLSNALQAIGRAKDREATIQHIRRRAKALGLTDMLPEWAVAKCTCGTGDATTLEVLRNTTMADMDVEDFSEIVEAVNKAGGIVKSNGLPRVLIAKAIAAYQEGFAKGDYVGHPFRGNQYADASGASRGGASSGVDRDNMTADQGRARTQQIRDKKRQIRETRVNEERASRLQAREAARSFVADRIVEEIKDGQADVANRRKTVERLSDDMRSLASREEVDAEHAEAYGDKNNPAADAARAYRRAAFFADKAAKLIAKQEQAMTIFAVEVQKFGDNPKDDGGNIDKMARNLSNRTSSGLQTLRRTVASARASEEKQVKAGRGSASAVAAMRNIQRHIEGVIDSTNKGVESTYYMNDALQEAETQMMQDMGYKG